MENSIYIGLASLIIWILAMVLYFCGVSMNVVWLLLYAGFIVLMIANCVAAGGLGEDIKRIEAEIAKHHKEKGW